MADGIESGIIGGTKICTVIVELKVPSGVSEAQFRNMVAQGVTVSVGFLPILAGSDLKFRDITEGLSI